MDYTRRDPRAGAFLIAIAAAILHGGCASSGTSGAAPGSSTGGHGGADAGAGGAGGAGGAAPQPTDAGGANPSDAPADAANDPSTPPADAGCGSLFCEDFEQGMIDPAKWLMQMGGAGTLAVQQQVVAHGKFAYHVHGSGAGGDFAMIISTSAPAALRGPGPLYGRAYVYAGTNVGSHIELGFAGSARDPAAAPLINRTMNFNYMEFAEFANSWQLGFDLFDPAPDVAKGFVEVASYPPARDKYPAGTWNCIEWEFSDAPDQMVLWVDGKQIDQLDAAHIGFSSTARTAGSVLNGKSSGIVGGYAFFGFGFHSYGGSTAVDRYFDDIALDTKRVGCLADGPAGG